MVIDRVDFGGWLWGFRLVGGTDDEGIAARCGWNGNQGMMSVSGCRWKARLDGVWLFEDEKNCRRELQT